jgi:hypothetical protein
VPGAAYQHPKHNKPAPTRRHPAACTERHTCRDAGPTSDAHTWVATNLAGTKQSPGLWGVMEGPCGQAPHTQLHTSSATNTSAHPAPHTAQAQKAAGRRQQGRCCCAAGPGCCCVNAGAAVPCPPGGAQRAVGAQFWGSSTFISPPSRGCSASCSWAAAGTGAGTSGTGRSSTARNGLTTGCQWRMKLLPRHARAVHMNAHSPPLCEHHMPTSTCNRNAASL